MENSFIKCWACGSNVRASRIENHHILGKDNSDETVPLCILCHDLVDRITIDNEYVLDQYLINCYNELLKLGDDFKWTKIFLLKTFKICKYSLDQQKNAKD